MTIFQFINKRKWLLIFPLVMVMALGAYSSIEVEISCAHTPQHVIDALEITPSYHHDQTVFIIVQNKLLKSTNGGISWKELVRGLDNTFVLSSIAISPEFEADQTVFASADGDGIYKSVDAGASWLKINQGLDNLGIGLMAISPAYAQDAMVLAAGAQGGLYKTPDGGQNWSEVLGQGVKVTTIAFSPDPDRELIVIGDDRGQIWSSEDKASSWQRAYRLPASGGVTTIAISDHFATDETFFAGTQQQGVFKTVDSGMNFVRLENGPSTLSVRREGRRHLIIRPADEHITALALSPDYARNERVFGATWYDAVFESDDGGRRWTKQALGISCDGQADEPGYNVPHFRHLKISKRFQEDGTLFLAGFDGLFKSTDGGRVWTQLETLPVSLIRGIGLSPVDEAGQFSLALTTYGGGAYTTADQGATWAIRNRGLKTTRLSDIAFSPTYQADNTLYSASQSNFLRSAADGVEHWERLGLDYNGWRKQLSSKLRRFGVPASVSNQLLLDEHEQDSNWPMVIVFSPNFASDRTLYFGTRRHGIFKSVDGGLSWPQEGQGPDDWVTALVISPDFATDRTLFAGIRERGVYKTVDGGQTWQPVNSGFEFLKEVALPVSPNYNVDPVLFASLKDIKLAISPAFGRDQTMFTSSNEGLFKTTDGGQTWHKLASAPELEHSNIESLAISPAYENDHMLLVSVKGKGLFKTGDGGDTFVEIGEQLIEQNQTLKWLAFSPLYPADKTIYAASEETLFRSVDDGQSWHSMPRPVRYENWRGEGHGPVKFDGPWWRSGGAGLSASSISASDTAQATATLYFTGTGVNWIGTEGPDQGLARVYIDGQLMAEVDQYSQSSNALVTSFAITNLADGAHSIMVEVTGTKNPASTGDRITIDAFDITPAG